MSAFLAVGLGGALGAMGRYGISLLPLKSAFPWLTLLTNVLGALVIGFVVGVTADNTASPNTVLFWKTGVCGGFTTFSTFSLETLRLFEGGQTASGLLYAGASVVLCVLGVHIGELMGRALVRRGG
ncbi:fluoride efflux transporter CrcB [Agathobaculum sp.]|uniref:fluoride efflux transporter CrcB n=1 Tax=Agathobaculum sp. TaxID=2048138 RepID=UPI001C3A770C|nr:fluoride efflux transporter CrcB [Agathobaculum sp.]HIX10338.1 fluoride efflux transporter CrcB [Candidatus Agathobaculum pullistercoris]